MEISILSVLSLFSLLTISSAIFLLSKKTKLPYTVLLVAAGLILVPLSQIPVFHFIGAFELTPELLFYIFLPALIFESAYNMNIREMIENMRSISLLAVVGLLISTFATGYGIYYFFPMLGYNIPIMVALIFGALISSTDPVAVLALFKEFGAPRRLSLIFEGESLLNDGTAVAVFLIMLQIARVGFSGTSTVLEGILIFISMVVGGILIGLILGGLFAKALEWTREYESASITLTIVAAHLTFILCEYISSHVTVYGHEVRISSIIATMTTAMVIGNYGRHKIGVRAEEFVEKFWGQIAFISNSIVFLLIGLLFADLPFSVITFIWPMLGAVVIVATARAISVYLPIAFLNKTKTEEHIPNAWQHLLAWGSLRGALAITLVLIIPDTLTFPGWEYSFTAKEFILALTIGCIYTTLFIKAMTIGPIMRKLKITDLSDAEDRQYQESRALIHGTVLKRLESFWSKGYIDDRTYNALKDKHTKTCNEHIKTCLSHIKTNDAGLSERMMRLYAIGIERYFLRELFLYGEVTEKVFKRILGKLSIQREHLEKNNGTVDLTREIDRKEVFERLARLVRNILHPRTKTDSVKDRFMYYRAQSIIARKVVKELSETKETYGEDVFDSASLTQVIALYEGFRTDSEEKMKRVQTEFPDIIHALLEELAECGVFKVEEVVLEDLKKKDMITQKLYITLKEELEKEKEER